MHDFDRSIKAGWKTLASSKDKGTWWLLINHSLPVKSRIDRKNDTFCNVCKGKGVDHTHVFNNCPRAKEIWKGVNLGTKERFGIEAEASFENALNVGLEEGISERIMDSLNQTVIHHMWRDYCKIEFGKEPPTPTQSVSDAILTHFNLTLEAELANLQADMTWWARKVKYKPGILTENVSETLDNLRVRMGGLRNLCKGLPLPEELGGLMPYSSKANLIWHLKVKGTLKKY